jgi:hypothetical protein
MFDDFLDHTCNISHTEQTTTEGGYGIKARIHSRLADGSTPELVGIPCHFHSKTGNTVRVVQNEPFSSTDGEMKMSLPAGTDVRVNDIIEDCRNGLKYRAGVPSTVHGGHHIIVHLYAEGGVKTAL